VLKQNQARSTDETVDQNGYSNDYSGVEKKVKRKCYQNTYGGTRCSRVTTNLYEKVANSTKYLHNQATGYNTQGVFWHAHDIHDIQQDTIAQDRDDIGHKTPLAFTDIMVCPSINFAIQIDAKPWRRNSHDIDHRKHIKAKDPRCEAQITEE
jgi:hypothetical protein